MNDDDSSEPERDRRRVDRAQARAKRVAEGGLRSPAGDETVLEGGFGAVSLPIEAAPGVQAFVHSERNRWLFPVGSGKAFGAEGSLPRRLNTPGWIFLRAENELRARVRFVGARRQQVRQEHIASDDGMCHDRGPGYVLEVDPSTWNILEAPISLSAAEQGNGYRYYDVDDEGLNPTFRTIG